MKRKLMLVFFGTFLLIAQAIAQQITITGKVTSEDGPIPGASIRIKGERAGTQSNGDGSYTIKAKKNDIITFSYIGYLTEEKIVGTNNVINVFLKSDAKGLDEVVVTALGNTVKKKELGTSQQTVTGAVLAESQRENFVNALQGRVAGVEVNTSSGVPGASSSITIRGVSSISGNNQPLMIVDGLPIDNKTLSTSAFVSDNSGSGTSFTNRGVDFSNRSADINPEDIESLVVLKGPEAAALYGIDAANGAIVITTKRAKAGAGAINYSNNFRVETVRATPEIQREFGIGTGGADNVITTSGGAFQYFGPKYPEGTKFYNNIDNFFQTGFTQRHNLSFEGGSENLNYRISTSYTDQAGVVPNSNYQRLNITGASQGIVNKWLKTDLSMNYSLSDNNQPMKGAIGPFLGLLVWPQTDNASDYLNASGTRKVLSIGDAGNGQVDNPYFNVNKNKVTSRNNRIISNLGFTITPAKWLEFKSNFGIDAYVNQNMIVRHPESAAGYSRGGIMDVANDVTTNINVQNLLNLKKQKLSESISFDATLGNSMQNLKSNIDAGYGENFLDPDFNSLNNVATRSVKTSIAQRRLVSFFARATFDYKNYLFITGTLRNDRTSTIPVDRYSFWYPSVQGSLVLTDVPAFEGLKKVFTYAKLRAAYANVGRDARPYAYVPSLEYKTTTNGGYGYGFTGPNPGLKPEFAKSIEFGAELSFLDNRLGIDATVYRKETTDQIVNDIRSSYGTGFVLLNLNGGSTRNQGLEITLRGTPVKTANFKWDVLANFESATGKVMSLPNGMAESYIADTWLYGNVRNGTTPGYSTRSITGFFYLKNKEGQLLINPTNGLPVRSNSFIEAGYDRQPDFTVGLSNTFTYKNMSLSFLLDIRKGGDILNATQHYLTARGLSQNTVDRMTPRTIPGVLQDGKENSANPTVNNISFIPYYQNGFYSAQSEELFIEKDINWIRLRDVTFSYRLPQSMLKKQNFIKNASVFVTGTDLFLITNYTGLDPVSNGNTAAVGGSGGGGIDYGNFPIPMGFNFGVKIGL